MGILKDELLNQVAELMTDGDAGKVTIKEYLKTLLSTLWRETEGFSGKRPFGNGSWQYDIYLPMVKAGIVTGEIDDQGYIDSVDSEQADKIIQALIASF